jgi:hypothetical protein
MTTATNIFYTFVYNVSVGLFSLFAFFNTFGIFYATIRSGNIPFLEKPDDYFHVSIVLFTQRSVKTFKAVANIVSYVFTGYEYFKESGRKDVFNDSAKKDIDIYEVKFNDLYDDMYYKEDKSKLMEENPLSQGMNNNANYTMDFTQQGTVFVGFDSGTKCFTYYSDRTVPNQTLVRLGRKFIVQMNCPQVCYLMEHRDDEEDADKNKEEDGNGSSQDTKPKRQGIAASRGVVAKLKPTVVTKPPEKSEKKGDGTGENTKPVVQREKYFKFNKRGTVMDFQLLQKNVYKKRLAKMTTRLELSLAHPDSLNDLNNADDLYKNTQSGEKGPRSSRDKSSESEKSLTNKKTMNINKSEMSFAEYKRIKHLLETENKDDDTTYDDGAALSQA